MCMGEIVLGVYVLCFHCAGRARCGPTALAASNIRTDKVVQ